YEWVMVGVNLFAAIVLTVNAYINHETLLFYAIPAAYLAYALLFGVLFRLRRRHDPTFVPTMLGDVDRAL
ncbi:MAG: hypothetical protein KDE19_19405, partial [Caldilineaceae bacterium]|nr:hypothetical protein [Caldilineaceae bacterium]